MRKLLSAITAPPSSSKFRSPLCLSVMDPVHSGGMKETTPVGVHVFVTIPCYLLA